MVRRGKIALGITLGLAVIVTILAEARNVQQLREAKAAPIDRAPPREIVGAVADAVPIDAFLVAGGRDSSGNAHRLLVDDIGRVIVSPAPFGEAGRCRRGWTMVVAPSGLRCAEHLEEPSRR